MNKSRLLYLLTIIGLVVIGLFFLSSLSAQAATVWTAQVGVYQKQLSNAATPRARYVLLAPAPIVTTAPTTGLPPECALKYKCFSPFGVVYDLQKHNAGSCPRVFIKRNEVGEYDGTQIINGLPVCE